MQHTTISARVGHGEETETGLKSAAASSRLDYIHTYSSHKTKDNPLNFAALIKERPKEKRARRPPIVELVDAGCGVSCNGKKKLHVRTEHTYI